MREVHGAGLCGGRSLEYFWHKEAEGRRAADTGAVAVIGFPISLDNPVIYPGPPPPETDVVVIGGGVIGVCTALYLARAGRRVTLLEKGRIAGEQSSRNWGWIRQQGRDPAELPIMMEALRLWSDLARETNVDFGLRQTGVTYLAQNDRQMATYEAWAGIAKAQGLETHLLAPDEVVGMFPDVRRRYAGGMTTPSDMRAEPWLAVPALAGIAARAGVKIIEDCAARRLDVEAGRITGVVTEAGRIGCAQVVLAGGAWSALFLRNHGISLPQLSVRETVVATGPMAEVHAGAAADSRLAFRRRTDGGYTLAASGVAELFIGPDAFRALPHYLPQLRAAPFDQTYRPAAPRGFPDAWRTPRRWAAEDQSPFERMRMLNPAPNRRLVARVRRDFAMRYPDLGPVQVRAAWAGMIDTLPDSVPVLDRSPDIEGLVIGTGMSGHGFGIGPGAGRCLAALVMGDEVGHDLTRFRASRFTDGSRIRLPPL